MKVILLSVLGRFVRLSTGVSAVSANHEIARLVAVHAVGETVAIADQAQKDPTELCALVASHTQRDATLRPLDSSDGNRVRGEWTAARARSCGNGSGDLYGRTCSEPSGCFTALRSPKADARDRLLRVRMAFPQFPRHRVNVFEPLAASHKQPDSRSLTSSVDDVDCRSTRCN
jgi:hypothetical protein